MLSLFAFFMNKKCSCVRRPIKAAAFFYLAALFVFMPLISYASNVAILVSTSVRPYIEAVDGLSKALLEKNVRSEVFYLERFQGKGRMDLAGLLRDDRWDLRVAVGPNAALFLEEDSKKDDPPILYTMVLNPAGVLSDAVPGCGVPLDIPVDVQMEGISRAMPGLRRLGLLYDPAYNSRFFEEGLKKAASLGLTIHPVAVTARKDIPSAIDANIDKIDAIWMIPDRTVIAESIVEYVIKEAMLKKIPTVGYNKFFYENGAAAAFVFDYNEIGRQTAGIVLDALKGVDCVTQVPRFRLWLNPRTLKVLGIDPPKLIQPPVEWGP
ncbi:MAG: hypothetical protein C4582_10670 [Desulfobacteraceae bacterium]|nr:MAG: hypothetical protein C4582_10670 [Desulfobacteraceae bacterium]